MKKYYEYLDEIEPEYLERGLLKYGLFNDKLPSILTSESFYEFIVSNPNPFSSYSKKEWRDWIRYESNRYNNMPRLLGIPNPISYYFLCREIKNDWAEIKSYFKSKTSSQTFKNSRIHIKKIKNKENIFEMNYDFQKKNGEDFPNDVVESKYVVKTDISKFFDSFYSHTIPWALLGKTTAKANQTDNLYPNRIDSLLRCLKCGETHGIMTGPVSSNLISEIVLCDVDFVLSNKYKYVRRIDDFCCFVDSIDEGNNFINDLRRCLAFYGLSLNIAKTTIIPVYEYGTDSFPDDIKLIDRLLDYQDYSKCEPYPDGVVSCSQLISYFNELNRLFIKYDCDGRLFLYSFKMLTKKNLSLKARKFFVNKAMNLGINCPYLLPYLQELVFDIHGVTNNLKSFCASLYDLGKKSNNYEQLFYSLYFSIVHGIDFLPEKAELMHDLKNIDDCLFKFIAWKFLTQFAPGLFDEEIKNVAKNLYRDSDSFDRNWIFVYEILSSSEMNSYWKKMKEANVSFIDEKKLETRTIIWSLYYD